MSKKSIVFFTIGYPYGIGDEFLEQEMKYAEPFFERILIVSCNKKTSKISQYVPKNAELISIRDKTSNVELAFLRFISLFSVMTWKQIFVGFRQRGLANAIDCIKVSMLEQSTIRLLKRNENSWIGKYSYYYSYWLSDAAAYLALRKKKISGLVFSRAHGYDCFQSRGFHPYRKEQLERIDYIFSISEAGKKDLIEQGGAVDKIFVSRLGVEKPESKMNPYFFSKKKTIVSCSNIVHLKRLDLLIEALSMIDNMNINWIHFGNGDQEKYIHELAKKTLQKKNNIHFTFRGRVSKEEIFDFYGSTSIDCFVNCSDVEGVPVSIMEAMSYGIPCIARDVGGNKEIVNNSNGILLSSECTPEDLRSSIETILSLSPDEYQLMRKSAYNTYVEKYNARNNYLRFYETILNCNVISTIK